MMMAVHTIHEQALEVENHILSLEDLLKRAIAKQIKRPPDWIDRTRYRIEVAQAALATLRGIEVAHAS